MFEGEQADAEAFYFYLQGQILKMFHSLEEPRVKYPPHRLYASFEVARNGSSTCKRGEHSPDGWETVSVSSADRSVLLGSQKSA